MTLTGQACLAMALISRLYLKIALCSSIILKYGVGRLGGYFHRVPFLCLPRGDLGPL